MDIIYIYIILSSLLKSEKDGLGLGDRCLFLFEKAPPHPINEHNHFWMGEADLLKS